MATHEQVNSVITEVLKTQMTLNEAMVKHKLSWNDQTNLCDALQALLKLFEVPLNVEQIWNLRVTIDPITGEVTELTTAKVNPNFEDGV